MKHKILFMVPYPLNFAPSQRLKFEQYYPYFKNVGFSLKHSSFISERMWTIIYKKGNYFKKFVYLICAYLKRFALLISVRKYDIVYVHLWCTPFGPPLYEWLLKKVAKKIVYDIDDLVFLKNISHENKFLAFLKGKNKPLFLMREANHVITCTPYLDAIAQKLNKDTTDISSTINTNYYQPRNKYNNIQKLVIGWSGSHSTSTYLYLLKDILLELNKSHPFKLLVMGNADFYIDGLDIEAIPWKEEWEISTLQRIDIGVYPLPTNEEWVLGKSGLKALQYMALGIPTVASDVGCNNRIIEHGVNGYLVNGNIEWEDCLTELMVNPGLRKRIGEAGRKKVVTNFSLDANKDSYIKILNALIYTS